MVRVALALLLFAVTAFGQSSSEDHPSALPKTIANDLSILNSSYGAYFDYIDDPTSWVDDPCWSDDYDIDIFVGDGATTGEIYMNRPTSWHGYMSTDIMNHSIQDWYERVDPITNNGENIGWFQSGYGIALGRSQNSETAGYGVGIISELNWSKLANSGMSSVRYNNSVRQNTASLGRASVGPSRRVAGRKGTRPSRRRLNVPPSGSMSFFDPYEDAAKAVMDVLDVTPGFDAARRAGLQLREFQATASQRFMLRIAELRSLVAKR